jgi:NADPH-dependent 2,4-dienoyl-CoA reductase/sulfur reductase-like enzyme/ferredoxin
MEMPRRLPVGAWWPLRITSVAFALLVAGLLIVEPETGLDLWWGLLVPALPLVWFVVPGLWRNLCPLAAGNQTPRALGFTRARTVPPWFREYAPVAGMALFVAAVASRPVVFNDSGPASAALILAALVAAFAGGWLFKGKSGWCSSLCPLLPVQRIYGQTPFKTVPNSHCQPCVGCTKHCYDFNPRVAYLADLYEDDRHYTGYRKVFAGAFPGIVLAYFTLDGPDSVGTGTWYLRFAGVTVASVGTFFLAETFVKASVAKIAAVYGAIAISLFYWYAAPIVAGTLTGGRDAAWIVWPLRVAVFSLTLLWVVRTWRKEDVFVSQGEASTTTRFAHDQLEAARAPREGDPEVRFADTGARLVAKPGQTLLDVAEFAEQPIEAGCRMGVCGADPVRIVDGMDCLSEIGDDERSTLERLGWGAETRMACCARPAGPVTVSMRLEQAGAGEQTPGEFDYDKAVQKVVVVGNGIAGVTAADHIRRRHPNCDVDIVASEPYPLYNRMGISRLIHGRSAMLGLHLLPDAWYDDNRITCWLNTRAVAIDRERREVRLGTGEKLGYDRLVLASGAAPFVPALEGFGAAGTYVLRAADDALRIREYVQRTDAEQAVVAGGGLLGLEAAYALRKLGLAVTVLERGPWLLRRQLDERAGDLLRTYLQNLGFEVLLDAEAARLADADRLRALWLTDGRELPANVFLMAAGIVPEIKLAAAAGLRVQRGVVVDQQLRTNDPEVFAVGDVAEFDGRVLGLWPAAVEQAEIAAENAVGGDRAYQGTIPVTLLKVVGVELASIGRITADTAAGEIEIVLEDREALRYRKLVIDADGHAAGAILLGYPQYAAAVTAVVRRGGDVAVLIDDLRAGDWDALEAQPVPS